MAKPTTAPTKSSDEQFQPKWIPFWRFEIATKAERVTTEFIVYLLIGAAAGGFISGLAGFGTALFALGWWLQVMSPQQAVAVILVMSVVSSFQGVIHVRKSIEWSRLSPFLLPGLLGIPIGLQILERINADHLKLVVALFMLVYGGFFTLRKDLPNLTKATPVMDRSIGFVGGILGAIAGLSGAFPTMWLSMRDWAKEKTRAVLQPYNISILGISAIALAFDGAYDRATLVTVLVALPVTMIAAQIGIATFNRLSDDQFRRLLIAMLLLSGIVLFVKEAVL